MNQLTRTIAAWVFDTVPDRLEFVGDIVELMAEDLGSMGRDAGTLRSDPGVATRERIDTITTRRCPGAARSASHPR